MATLQDLISQAQRIAKDVGGRRYPADVCLPMVNLVIKEAKRVRPDLFFGKFGTPYADLALTATFPLPPEYEPGAIKAIVSWIDVGDDEYSNDGRAAAFMKMWQEALLA